MNNFLYLLIIACFLSSCSLNKNSKFWTSTKKIKEESNFEKILKKDEVLEKTFNINLKIKIDAEPTENLLESYLRNNDGRKNFDLDFKKVSKYKFSKLKNFSQYEPILSSYKNNIIFFDNNGTILNFNDDSKIVWKKNFYSKSEKKLNPILQFSNNDQFLIVADNIAKYYLINLETGDLIWKKDNLAPFNSQIKIYKDKFFIIDFSNTLRCFSLENGKEIWNIQTENTLIRSQKKLSMVINNDKIFFLNSIGDITAVNINNGDLLWQLPTQNSSIYESSFTLKNSDLVLNKEILFFSNNKNEIFSIDTNIGNFNWKNNINSSLRPTIVGNLLLTVSSEGYLFFVDKNSGNILKVTDIFGIFKKKTRSKVYPTGFILGLNKIYLSTNIGKLLIIDVISGKIIKSVKIDNEKISRPFLINNNLFLIKDNAIIKLN